MQHEHKKSMYSLVLISLFSVFLLLFACLMMFSPKREFSPMENRYLKQFPAFSWQALFEKNWTLEFETFVTDQFPYRDQWVGAKALSAYALGKRENNGVYLGKDEYLIQDYQTPGEVFLAKNASYINQFAKAHCSTPVYFALVPDSVLINRDRLPAYSIESDQEADILFTQNELSTSVMYIDLLTTMRTHQSEPLYYRTDHHWTSIGAMYAYQTITERMQNEVLPLEAFDKHVLSENFQGTLQAKSGTWWIHPDEIIGYTPSHLQDVVSEIYEDDKLQLTLPGFYAMERLQTHDQYSVFLDGNHARVVITTGQPGKKLLLFKDSFGHALAPLLCANYAEIHMVDLRYYKVDYSAYLQEHGIDEVLFLYSMSNFSSDRNLAFLNFKP